MGKSARYRRQHLIENDTFVPAKNTSRAIVIGFMNPNTASTSPLKDVQAMQATALFYRSLRVHTTASLYLNSGQPLTPTSIGLIERLVYVEGPKIQELDNGKAAALVDGELSTPDEVTQWIEGQPIAAGGYELLPPIRTKKHLLMSSPQFGSTKGSQSGGMVTTCQDYRTTLKNLWVREGRAIVYIFVPYWGTTELMLGTQLTYTTSVTGEFHRRARSQS